MRAIAPVFTAAIILSSAGGVAEAGAHGGGGGKPITISFAQNLEFGSLAGDASSAGTAVINAATGAKTVTGGAADFGGVSNAASFNLTGANNTAYTIILPGTVTLSSGGNTMSLGSFTSNPAGAGVLDGTGKATLDVGGTLTVAAGQTAGAYTGVFSVIVNY